MEMKRNRAQLSSEYRTRHIQTCYIFVHNAPQNPMRGDLYTMSGDDIFNAHSVMTINLKKTRTTHVHRHLKCLMTNSLR